MDFTESITQISWGKGYEVGFRAGWTAHEELIESRTRWEDKSGPFVDPVVPATDVRNL